MWKLFNRYPLCELSVDENGLKLEGDEKCENHEIRNAMHAHHSVIHESTMEEKESEYHPRHPRTNKGKGSDRGIFRSGKFLEISVCFHERISEDSEECLNRRKNNRNSKEGSLVDRRSYNGMKGVLVSDERDSEEGEIRDDNPSTRRVLEGKSLFERRLVSDDKFRYKKQGGDREERHRGNERNARGCLMMRHGSRPRESNPGHGERKSRKKLREIVIGIHIEVSGVEKPSEIPYEHSYGYEPNNDKARNGEREYIFNDRPESWNHGCCKSEKHIHSHSKRERDGHELNFRIAGKEFGIRRGFTVCEICSDIFIKEGKMCYTKENESRVCNHDGSLNPNISTLKSHEY